MAFEYASFVNRNPLYATKNWRRQKEVRKNMLAYRKSHHSCDWCGRTHRLQVHHKVPVWAEPLLAWVTSNFIVVCFKCHLYVMHNGNFATRFEEDVDLLVNTHKVSKKVE